MTEITNN